jgi:hypothetical protein
MVASCITAKNARMQTDKKPLRGDAERLSQK